VLTQGLPLALVLAARWTPSLSTAAIVRELEAGLDLLTAHGQQGSERQRSMRTVLKWTWARLAAQDRAAMRRLSVFQPGFTPEAAQAVAAVGPATLLALREGALLDGDPAAERYAMHEYVRQYAAEQLADRPDEEDRTRARHAGFYAALVRRLAPALRQTVMAREAISADSANIRVAWDWAAEHADAAILEHMLEGMAKWYELQGLTGQSSEALGRAAERLRDALAQAGTPHPSVQRLLGFVLVEEAISWSWQGAHRRAVSLFEEARDLARVTASLPLEGRVAYCLGWQLVRQRELPSAMRWTEQALALARAAQLSDLEADALLHLGMGAVHAGTYPQARDYLDRALTLYRAQHHRLGELLVTYALGLMAHARGDYGAAQRLLEDALQLTRVLEWRLVEDWALHGLGQVHDEGWGRHVEAEDCFARDLRLTQQTGDRTREGYALAALGRNALYQGDLERARTLFDRALDLSREITSHESAAMALRGLSLLAHYDCDDRRARRCAEEALEIEQSTGLRRGERLALRLLGHALLGQGDRQAALVAYQRATDLDESLGLPHLRPETATDLARVALAQGYTAQAAARVAAVVPDLKDGTLAGLEEPALAYLTCYQVLRAAGDAGADEVLAAGHTFLEQRAAQFVDQERRSRFLDSVPAHRELLGTWRARGGSTAGAGEASGWTGAVPHLRVVRS
jgi:tetratricopeptide (TPR) repeat protein